MAAFLSACERPPVVTVQGGYRGTGMLGVYNPRTLETQAELNAEPEIARAARLRPGAPTAGEAYENVKVLGDLSITEFGRTMTAITSWVSPEAGCLYCHVEGNFASDEVYTKVVARRMFQMVQHMNATWRDHVADTGVTCYTCHRGHPVPKNIWVKPVPRVKEGSALGDRAGQNIAAPQIGLTSLPGDPFSAYLLGNEQIRVNGTSALPPERGTPRAPVKQAELSYALMIHMSKSLGVNCTFCHNGQSFQSWEISAPQRTTAWHGIRLVRDLNQDYLTADPLIGIFPPNRRGPMGDVAKVNCATCHQGAYKPLYGSHLAQYYPAVLPASMRPEVPLAAPPKGEPLPPVRADPRVVSLRR
jgi:photosynthetic reaction center cytochrome c subunit